MTRAILLALALGQFLPDGMQSLPRSKKGTTPGSLFTDPTGVTDHSYWSGGIQSKQSTAWTMTGTVPQVAASGKTPPGAGPFSTANFYTTTLAADPYDFSSSPWYICAAFSIPDTTGTYRLVDGSNSTATLGFTTYTTGGSLVVQMNSPAKTTVASGVVSTAFDFVCFGWDGTNYLAKANTGTTVANAGAAMAPATTFGTRLGLSYASNQPLTGEMLEVLAVQATPSDAVFAAQINHAKAAMGIP